MEKEPKRVQVNFRTDGQVAHLLTEGTGGLSLTVYLRALVVVDAVRRRGLDLTEVKDRQLASAAERILAEQMASKGTARQEGGG